MQQHLGLDDPNVNVCLEISQYGLMQTVMCVSDVLMPKPRFFCVQSAAQPAIIQVQVTARARSSNGRTTGGPAVIKCILGI